MSEVITISKEERLNLFNQAPAGFRFAEPGDFHENGIRKEQLTIFILQWGSECNLVEYIFNQETPRNWLQWLLDSMRVMIRIQERPGKQKTTSYFIIPNDDFLIQEIQTAKENRAQLLRQQQRRY